MRERAQSPWIHLRSQMLLVLLLFGLTPLFAASAAGYLANQSEIEARTRNVLEAMVKNRKATVDLFLEEKLRQLEQVAASHSVAELSDRRVLESLLAELARDRGGIVDLGLIGADGRHRAYVGPYRVLDQDYSRELWFQHVMVLGRYESDVFLGFRRFPHMVMAARKQDDGESWVLRATIDTDLLSTLAREGGLESGADVFILNKAGEYQTRASRAHRLMEKANLPPIPDHSGVRIVEDHRRRNAYLATAWLRGGSWVLVARQEVPGAFAILSAQPVVVVVFLAGILLVPILSVVVARHRLRQIRDLETNYASLYESVAQTQKMAAIGRLAAGVAHEINNPLAIIDAQVGVLSDVVADEGESPLTSELKQRLRTIRSQVERGKKVTHRLLGFSRRVGPDVEPVDVTAALDETVGFVEKEAEASKLRITRDYQRDVPIIRSSLAQMQQVFLNLINNAMDAMGSDGELFLAVSTKDGGVEVRIRDNGPGIGPKDLQRVFEPFYSTKADRHTGLGLAICQEIMKSLGGRIGVSSTLGAGTEFSLWFPPEVLAEAGRARNDEVELGSLADPDRRR